MGRVIYDTPAARAARAAARGNTEQPAIIAGTPPREYQLPRELPLSVFAPFLHVNEALGVLLVGLKDVIMGTADGEEADTKSMSTVIDVIGAYPELPRTFLDAVAQVGRDVMGEDGYAAFVADKPSREDVTGLFKALAGEYGVDLGKLLGSWSSAETGGKTSTPTSEPASASTPTTFSDGPETPGSSESAA